MRSLPKHYIRNASIMPGGWEWALCAAEAAASTALPEAPASTGFATAPAERIERVGHLRAALTDEGDARVAVDAKLEAGVKVVLLHVHGHDQGS